MQSFLRQGAMQYLGANVIRLEPGYCDIEVAYKPELSQQNGLFHAGVTSAIADSSGGYAAYTLFAQPADVLTVEFKINLLEPAKGERLVARGSVLRQGKKLTTCMVEVFAVGSCGTILCAIMTQTVVRVTVP